ncbi:MAG: response regulator [Candidatus Scalindua sp.]
MEKKKIILVEDDPDHADLITEVLVEGDIETETVLVQDGMEALDYFQEFVIKWNGQIEYKIKLIILDLNLPKISGMDILKFLKNDSNYSKIPVIILSTSSDQRTIDEAYKNGVNGYFVKPASYEEFVEKIRILKKFC